MKKKLAMAVVAGLAATACMGVAPATYDPGRDIPPPPVDSPAPPEPMKQNTVCATSAVIPDSQFDSIPANVAFGVDELHKFATGAGQRVAVIDSGVTPNIRLPHLTGGGDFIMGSDGLQDCDHHGTIVAGIIGAQPATGDGFIGVAPDAEIISIRQTSAAFTPENPRSEEDTGSSLATLAKAIRRAADMGATVINMSVTACVPASSNADLRELTGAMAYAALDKDVVLVSSAGNITSACETNPSPDWESVTTISLPSYIDQFVLSVGGTTLTADQPYVNTLPGPWVDVAAPAINIVSLDPAAGDSGGLINGEVTQQGTSPLTGTSFAAAYVSGLAALIRQAHPELTANQVRNRIINSSLSQAESMSHLTGHGSVNALKALTGRVDDGDPLPQGIVATTAGKPAEPEQVSKIPMYVGGAIAVLAVIILGVLALRATVRKD